MTLQHKLFDARAAQPGFEALGFKARACLLKKAGKEMLQRYTEVAELLEIEAHKIYPEILLSEAIGPLQYIKDWIQVAKPFLKPQRIPIPAMAFPSKKAVRTQVARGVVGIITPFNYPFGNFFKPVFAALLCGNSVIIKPSEYTPKTADWFLEIMNRYLPAGVLQLHHGAGEAGAELILSGIDAVTFTGSWQTGQKVAKLAAERMIPCSFELGGKDAALVLADCDLDRSVAGILHWAFHNAGQSCGAIDRVYVEEAIANQFVERLSMAASKLDGMIGPVVPPHHPKLLEELVADAIAKGSSLRGAKGDVAIHAGSLRSARDDESSSKLPKILDNCNHSMRIMREPTFGPLLPIMRVKSGEEAIALINNCDYGLCGSVWSKNITRATKLAQQFQVGTAYVNNHSFTGAIPAAPWTGVKHTGYGIANSEFSLAHYTRPFTLVIDRKKSPDAWWFPLNGIATKLGECLAKAQLGDLIAAIQIPWLIFKRQRQVLAFVQQKKKLFNFEAHWGQVIMESLVWRDASPEHAQEFISEVYKDTPALSAFGTRAAIWLLALSPIWKFKAFKTIDKIGDSMRTDLLAELYKSDVYLIRQLVMFMKLHGANLHAATSRVIPQDNKHVRR